MPCFGFLAFPFVARFLCGGRKGTFAFRVGQLSIAALGFASFALAGYLIHIGDKAHWTSDGPGMLGVMLVILVSGFLALVFGAMLVGTFTRDDPDREDGLASVRTGLAALIVLSTIVWLAWLGWRLSRG